MGERESILHSGQIRVKGEPPAPQRRGGGLFSAVPEERKRGGRSWRGTFKRNLQTEHRRPSVRSESSDSSCQILKQEGDAAERNGLGRRCAAVFCLFLVFGRPIRCTHESREFPRDRARADAEPPGASHGRREVERQYFAGVRSNFVLVF